jgi:hypothetical protein
MQGFFGVLSPVTLGFIIVISVAGLIFQVRFNRKTAELGPTLLTTTGIFGTFVGIALGLYHFDTSNVEASIPALLEGLKTAFFASVFGVGFAITLKLREFAFGTGTSDETAATSDDVSGADLIRHLLEIRVALNGPDDGSLISQMKLTRQDGKEQLETLRSLQRSLSGSEDGSLLTQIRLLRQDSNDRLDALRVTMGEALKKLSEMGSQALIEALRDVIRDFNDKITEQFGENFKQLNFAVGKLLVWQEQYKTTIETTVAKLGEIGRLVGDLTGNFSAMVERSGRFADVADRLGAMLTTLEGGERRLKEQSEALAALLLKASGSLPEIERKIEELSTQMANAVRENQRVVSAALTESASALRGSVDSLRQDVAKVSADLSGMVTRNQEAVSRALTENATAIRTSLDSAQRDMTGTNADFNRQLRELADKTKEQVATLDAALQKELQTALQSLAQQFTAISGRFAQDYGNLADTLKKIVDSTRVGR